MLNFGIKEGTIDTSTMGGKVGKVALGIGEGALNAFVAPINPRWWAKAVEDIKGIKGADYGGGKAGGVLKWLARTSQLAQKIGTIAGVVGLALGIAAACLGALMGAGAACALGASVCGLISMIAAGVAFVIQTVLVVANAIRGGLRPGGMTAEMKKRFWGDIAGMIGSAIAVTMGGLSVNFGGGHGLFSSQGSAVTDAATKHLANTGELVNGQVVGATSVGSQVGQQFANAGMGLPAGGISDAISETVGVAAKHDPSLLQRNPDDGGGSGGAPDHSELLAAISAFLGSTGGSKSDDKKTISDMKSSIEAVNKTDEVLSTPLGSVPGAKGGKGSDMSVNSGVESAETKINEVSESITQAEGDTQQTGKYKKKDAPKLEQADSDIKKAESKLGVQGEEAKKPSLFRRMKDWLVSKVLNLKKRIAGVLKSAKAKLISFTMDVLGVKKDMDELKTSAAMDKVENEQTVSDAEGSMEATEDAEKKAAEFVANIGKK